VKLEVTMAQISK